MAVLDPHPRQHPESAGSEPQGTFGRYLLFKRLAKGALGEVYRAGQMGSDAVERVVTLRLFNSSEVNGPSFWQACESRRVLSTILRGGPFGEVVDAGCEDGIAYVAHEFVFGRTLSDLLVQARASSYPVPLEHTLHIMDRVAIALQNANQKRIDEKRILHGFLIPEFIHLSNEGELHLTGFESSPGLLALPAGGATRAPLSGYISPEVNAAQPAEAADDIYSLGAIFGQLLTGEPLPALDPTGSSRWVDSAILAEEAEPLPDDVKLLLRESLLPRAQRIRSAEKWHRALVAITNASDCSPTTFNLAFFMHTLFGDELDREQQIVEAERQAEIPPVLPPAPTAAQTSPSPVPSAPTPVPSSPAPVESTPPPATPAPIESTPVPTESAPDSAEAAPASAEPSPEPVAPPDEASPAEPEFAEPAAEPDDELSTDILTNDPTLLDPSFEIEPPNKPATNESRAQSAPSSGPNRKTLGLAAAAILVIGGVVATFVLDLSIPGFGKDGETMEVAAAPRLDLDATAAAIPETGALDDLGSVAPPLSPEEIEGQVRSLVARRAGALEANLKAEYDQRLVELRKQLEVARQASSEEQDAAVEAAPEAVTPPPAKAKPVKPERVAVTNEAATAPGPSPEQIAQAAPQQPSVSLPTSAPPTAPPARDPQAEPVRRAEPEPVVETPPASPQRETATEKQIPDVEPGAIVSQGPGVTAPRLVQRPQVVYPPAAKRLRREATVKVRVLVNENGAPVDFEQVGKTVGLGFDQAALKAAKTTRWTPPVKNGLPVQMWVELSIDFRP